METKNFSEMLNKLNSDLNLVNSVNSVYQKKYDYESLNIAKSLQKSFRVKFRKNCEKIYFSSNDLISVQKFINEVEKSLLVCTIDKKRFYQLSANEIFHGYEKLSEKDKKIVNEKHKLFCEICKPEKIETETEKKSEKKSK